jgi:hypothetical protein
MQKNRKVGRLIYKQKNKKNKKAQSAIFILNYKLWPTNNEYFVRFFNIVFCFFPIFSDSGFTLTIGILPLGVFELEIAVPFSNCGAIIIGNQEATFVLFQ